MVLHCLHLFSNSAVFFWRIWSYKMRLYFLHLLPRPDNSMGWKLWNIGPDLFDKPPISCQLWTTLITHSGWRLTVQQKLDTFHKTEFKKNPAYGRNWISRLMRIVAAISFFIAVCSENIYIFCQNIWRKKCHAQKPIFRAFLLIYLGLTSKSKKKNAIWNILCFI